MKLMKAMNAEEINQEPIRMVERMVVLRVAAKHINLCVRQLEMKRREVCELAGLIGYDEVEIEIENEISKAGQSDEPIASTERQKGCCSKMSTRWR